MSILFILIDEIGLAPQNPIVVSQIVYNCGDWFHGARHEQASLHHTRLSAILDFINVMSTAGGERLAFRGTHTNRGAHGGAGTDQLAQTD